MLNILLKENLINEVVLPIPFGPSIIIILFNGTNMNSDKIEYNFFLFSLLI